MMIDVSRCCCDIPLFSPSLPVFFPVHFPAGFLVPVLPPQLRLPPEPGVVSGGLLGLSLPRGVPDHGPPQPPPLVLRPPLPLLLVLPPHLQVNTPVEARRPQIISLTSAVFLFSVSSLSLFLKVSSSRSSSKSASWFCWTFSLTQSR